eukprot:TRINITY_DN44981_c0_g1_i1.p1 TRINITY_DN44981_c0_g1~~TRINITY_DN44981_c0_g1_i1.p1  ORF type:complete len:689 (+),score=96.94 TRINITY_DN44981_c0_g1_i1:77-2068(+)
MATGSSSPTKKARLDAGGETYSFGFADVQAAHKLLQSQPRYQRTPTLRCLSIEEMLEKTVGRKIELFFKCEHLQATGSFKIRGALNAVLSLPEAVRRKGVITHSSGNHGQGIALAAQLSGIPATIVVPRNTPATKIAAVRGYGADIVYCEPTLKDREEVCARVSAETGRTFISSGDCPVVMAGQGTVSLEMCEDVEALDAIVIPISIGGLIGGCAVAAHGASRGRKMTVFAAEPLGADDAWQSKRAGHVVSHSYPPSATICDALRINKLGKHNWPIVRDLVEDVFVVPDGQCVETMKLIYSRMKQAIEPSGAIATASLFTPAGVAALRSRPEIRRVCVLLCGGNLDLDDPLPWAPKPCRDYARVCRVFRDCFDEVRSTLSGQEGRVYDKQVVEGLSDQPTSLFGAALALPDGRCFHCGDADTKFQLQSTFKPFTYGLALEELGVSRVHELVGAAVCLGGHASVGSARLADGRAHNPLINAGALRLLAEMSNKMSAEDIVARLAALAELPGDLMHPDDVALRATRAQQAHNVQLCQAFGLSEDVAKRACDLYASADCMRGNCRVLAALGARLAAEKLFGSRATARAVLAVMLGCGMYEASPEWAVRTGLPAKSGVSGVVFGAGVEATGVGKIGLCAFAPPVDSFGNSVRAQAMISKFCERIADL